MLLISIFSYIINQVNKTANMQIVQTVDLAHSKNMCFWQHPVGKMKIPFVNNFYSHFEFCHNR